MIWSNGTASYDPNTQSVIFTPTTGYTGTASFKYSITDANGGNASATASLLVNDPSTLSLFNPTTTPSIVTVNDPSSVELGVKFQASTDGEITGLRFYKGPDNDGTHTADLWNATTGDLLATATFTNETPEGWQQVNFSEPVAITAGDDLCGVLPHEWQLFGRSQFVRHRAYEWASYGSIERCEWRQWSLRLWERQPNADQQFQRNQLRGRRHIQRAIGRLGEPNDVR